MPNENVKQETLIIFIKSRKKQVFSCSKKDLKGKRHLFVFLDNAFISAGAFCFIQQSVSKIDDFKKFVLCYF